MRRNLGQDLRLRVRARPSQPGHPCITYSSVSLHASIIKISRLFLYFFSKRGSIYPKLHTDYGFCYVLRFFKESGEKLSAIQHRWWSVRAAITGEACNGSVLAGWRELGQVDRQRTKAHMQDLHEIRTIMMIYGVYSNGLYILFDLGCR